MRARFGTCRAGSCLLESILRWANNEMPGCIAAAAIQVRNFLLSLKNTGKERREEIKKEGARREGMN